MNTTCNNPAETAPAKERDETVHQPRFTTKEDEHGVTLHIALPAVAKQDLKLTLLESNLRVEARRSDAVPDTWKTLQPAATPERYRLDVRLTTRFDGSKAKATLDAGVLTLQVPVREEAKPRQIEIN
jgi:HSP20 family protein